MENFNKFTNVDRIDFNDYRNHYDDLKNLDNDEIINHYTNIGKFESRIFKFKNFNYNKLNKTINEFLTYVDVKNKFTLIINLYNEVNEIRMMEYIIALQHNCNNQFIENIIVFFDKSNGLCDISNHKKIKIIYIDTRPSFYYLINYCNENFKGINIILANGDIIFDQTLNNINNIEGAITSLTRWEFINEVSVKPRLKYGKIMTSSKDTWIFKSPLNILDINDYLKNIYIGTWECDGMMNKYLDLSKKIIHINECLKVKSYHIHFCNSRNYKDKYTIL